MSLAVALLGSAPTGGVYVTTLPAGADVWVDGTYLGHSPVLLDALPAGSHHLTLTRTGWTSQDLGVTVVASATVTASVVLARDGRSAVGTGTIAIHGVTVGSVLVDGETKTLGKDGTLNVDAGTHDVALVLPQGKITRSVTVYPQMRTDVVVEAGAPARSVVIAPADDYVPAAAVLLTGDALSLHYGRHDVSARLGSTSYTVDHRTVVYDAAPTVIKNRVYLPIELLTLLTASDKN